MLQDACIGYWKIVGLRNKHAAVAPKDAMITMANKPFIFQFQTQPQHFFGCVFSVSFPPEMHKGRTADY